MAEEISESTALEGDRELGVAPINKLFFKYTFSTMVGMAAQALMVIFEGIIIGNYLGEIGLATCAVLMPVEYINLGVGAALSMGVSTAVARRFGAGDKEGAQRAFSQGFWLSAYISLAIGVVFQILCPQLVTTFGATPDIYDSAVVASRIFGAWLPIEMMGQMLCGMLRVDEKPGVASAIMTGSAVLALAWLYFSVSTFNLGIVGAAHYYGASIGLWFVAILWFVTKNAFFRVDAAGMKVGGVLAGEVIKVGLPSLLVQLATTVYTAIVNNELGAFGGENATTQLAAFTLLSGYIVYVVNMMWQCAQYAVQPIAAYNFGANEKDRLKRLIRVTIVGTAAIVGIVSIVFIVFARPIVSVFTGGDQVLIEIAVKAVLPMCLLTCIGCSASMMSTYFQSVEKVGLSMFLGILKYLATIPAIFALTKVMGIDGVWWAMPVGDAISFLVTLAFVAREIKSLSK